MSPPPGIGGLDLGSGDGPDGDHDDGVPPARADDAAVRWRMVVAYDGSTFHGSAAQRDQATVAGALAEALARVVRAPVVLTCAGRTDSVERAGATWFPVVMALLL